MNNSIHIFWFRRDLRLQDNAGLYHALKAGKPVLPVFIFDTDILNRLEQKADRRISFIHATLEQLNKELARYGTALRILHDNPLNAFKQLLKEYNITAVYTNRDYEPETIKRDRDIGVLLSGHGASFHHYKDQVIFDQSEITKDDGTPYTVFTPYSRKWLEKLGDFYLKPYPTLQYAQNFYKVTKQWPIPSVRSLGFGDTDTTFHAPQLPEPIIRHYDDTRDKPAIQGTSRLGLHLRFGTVSIRKLAAKALEWNDTWLKELIWREFFMSILFHFPQVQHQSFKKQYDLIPWRNKEAEFEAWCEGRTGYPIVDAGMRELNATGFMHNRVRMVTASFLTKHLLIDWRWGEAYFARQLLDYDLAANNGNWQWAAGCGCDAAPYFRVFNPYEQTRKFDPELEYIHKWVPELDSLNYPAPMVDHKQARERALAVYKKALSAND